jgi:hypothetical protein
MQTDPKFLVGIFPPAPGAIAFAIFLQLFNYILYIFSYLNSSPKNFLMPRSASRPFSFDASCSLHRYLYSRSFRVSSARAGNTEASARKVTGPIAGSNFRFTVVSRFNGFKYPFGFFNALFYNRAPCAFAIKITVIAFNGIFKSEAIAAVSAVMLSVSILEFLTSNSSCLSCLPLYLKMRVSFAAEL